MLVPVLAVPVALLLLGALVVVCAEHKLLALARFTCVVIGCASIYVGPFIAISGWRFLGSGSATAVLTMAMIFGGLCLCAATLVLRPRRRIVATAEDVALLVRGLRGPRIGRRTAAEQLAAIGPAAAEAVPALAQALADEEPEVRRAAVRALGAIGPAAWTTVPALRELEQDDDEVLRDLAAAAVWKIARPAPETD